MNRFISYKKRLTSFQIIILGFSWAILLGAILLTLPVSGREGEATPFLEALFTSTSAVCVTGLVLHDTATYWSPFGQLVILFLIQVGGIGVITAAASFAMISGKRISLMQRSTMQEAIAAPNVGGVVRLTHLIVKITLFMELLGAAVMAPVFCRDFGVQGLWMALFHSVSAFCNAGFDLMGTQGAFSSLTAYAAEPVINLTVIFLILVGGIGFLTWDDICRNSLQGIGEVDYYGADVDWRQSRVYGGRHENHYRCGIVCHGSLYFFPKRSGSLFRTPDRGQCSEGCSLHSAYVSGIVFCRRTGDQYGGGPSHAELSV